MQRLEVSGAVRPIYGSLGVKRLNTSLQISLLGIASYGNSEGDRDSLRNAGLVEPTDAAVNRRGFY